MQRRTLLRGGIAALAAALWPEQGRASATGASTAQIARTRLILFGTGGGPRPRATTSAPSQVVVANGTPYVIDCGDGVARQHFDGTIVLGRDLMEL